MWLTGQITSKKVLLSIHLSFNFAENFYALIKMGFIYP